MLLENPVIKMVSQQLMQCTKTTWQIPNLSWRNTSQGITNVCKKCKLKYFMVLKQQIKVAKQQTARQVDRLTGRQSGSQPGKCRCC